MKAYTTVRVIFLWVGCISQLWDEGHSFSVPVASTLTSLSTTTTLSTTTAEKSLETVLQEWIDSRSRRPLPLTNSVLFFPPELYSQHVTYIQTATNTQLSGLSAIQHTAQQWEQLFETTDDDNDNEGNTVQWNIQRFSVLSPDCVIVHWNMTWIPPTAHWLLGLAQSQNWKCDYRSYMDQSGQICTFSYVAVLRLFANAVQTNTLTLPLACIEGKTICEFSVGMVEADGSTATSIARRSRKIHTIREDLALVQELKSGYLKNRKCAQDLKLFLECGRRMMSNVEDDEEDAIDRRRRRQPIVSWDEIVDTRLPWSSVPGLMGLQVDPNAEGEEWVPVAFLGFSAFSMATFAWLVIASPDVLFEVL